MRIIVLLDHEQDINLEGREKHTRAERCRHSEIESAIKEVTDQLITTTAPIIITAGKSVTIVTVYGYVKGMSNYRVHIDP